MNDSRLKYYYRYLESKYTLLLLSLLTILIITPFLKDSFLTQIFTALIYNFTIVLVIIALRDKKHNIVGFSLLALANIIVGGLDLSLHQEWMMIAKHLLYITFAFSAIIAIFSDVNSTKHVTHDTMFGAISIYLLIGIAYGTLYILVESLHPGSFVFAHNRQPVTDDFDIFYYSFITLTTVGYGDIIMINSLAKPIVILESITGIFYLAILVARLVSMRN